jgi:hypothetical protein
MKRKTLLVEKTKTVQPLDHLSAPLLLCGESFSAPSDSGLPLVAGMTAWGVAPPLSVILASAARPESGGRHLHPA